MRNGDTIPSGATSVARAETPAARWPFLDLVRYLAALLVMVGHARGYFFPNYAELATPNVLTKAFYLVTGLQHEAVVLFFVVSGFLVGGSAWTAFSADRFNATRYLASRFARIYLVFVPGLALAIVIHAIGTQFFPGSRSFGALPEQAWTLNMALCHLGCLQGIYCSVFVGNAPLWSLGYEWVLYLGAALVLAIAFAPVRPAWRVVAMFLLGAMAFAILPGHLLWSLVAVWVIGALAHQIAIRRPIPFVAGAMALVAACLFMLLARTHLFPGWIMDLAIAVSFGAALCSARMLALCPAPRLLAALADTSYSLYVIHLPVIMLTVALLETGAIAGPIEASAANLWMFALTSAIAVGAAILFAAGTEAHTARFRRMLLGAAGVRAAPDDPPGHGAGDVRGVQPSRQ